MDNSSFTVFVMGLFDSFLEDSLKPLDYQIRACQNSAPVSGLRVQIQTPAITLIELNLVSTFECRLESLSCIWENGGGWACRFGCQVLCQELLPGASLFQLLLLFWPVCIALATARVSLFLLHSAWNPLRVGLRPDNDATGVICIWSSRWSE